MTSTPQTSQPEKLAYSVKSLADALDVSPATVWRYLSEEKLQAVRSGHRTLILASEARRFVESLPPAA